MKHHFLLAGPAAGWGFSWYSTDYMNNMCAEKNEPVFLSIKND